MTTRHLVLVSGPPGVGKSTLAVPLAEELDLPLLAKDHVKEILPESLSNTPADRLTPSGELGAAAMELIWGLAARCPQVMLEANFWPGHRDLLRHLASFATADIVELHCWCAPEEAVRRYAARASRAHSVHVVREISVATVKRYEQPLGVGQVIPVDTSVAVDVLGLADEIRRVWQAASDE